MLNLLDLKGVRAEVDTRQNQKCTETLAEHSSQKNYTAWVTVGDRSLESQIFLTGIQFLGLFLLTSYNYNYYN